MDTDEPTIVVDDRERSSGIVELLDESGLFEIKVERLDIGDYLIADLVIERKTANDF